MVEQLFGSKTRVKLLKLFMNNPNRSFYVREITRKIDEQINSVRRELSNLLSIGIINSESSSNNRLYYEVNQKYQHYDALRSLFAGKAKTTKADTKKKVEDDKPTKKQTTIGQEEQALGNVDLVVLSGHFTRDPHAPADILIVGSVNPTALNNYVTSHEKSSHNELRYAHFTKDEFNYRMQIKDRFLTTMLESKLTVKVDKNNVLDKIKT